MNHHSSSIYANKCGNEIYGKSMSHAIVIHVPHGGLIPHVINRHQERCPWVIMIRVGIDQKYLVGHSHYPNDNSSDGSAVLLSTIFIFK